MPTSKKYNFPKAEIKLINNRSALVVDGKPIPPMAYTTDYRISSEQAVRLANGGINLYFIWLDSGWHDTSSWKEAEEETNRILSVNPNAYIILRVACHPALAWLDENQQECETFEDGRTDYFRDANQAYIEENWYPRMVCLASRKYAETQGEYLRKMIDFVESSDFGRRVIGYFLIGGGTGEWYYPMAYEGLDKHCFGFSPAFKKFYSEWLMAKYGSESNLRRAWKDTNASFENPRIPKREERLLYSFEYPLDFFPHEGRLFLKGDWGNFIDPKKSQFLADFYESRTAGTAKTIEYLAKVIKEKTGGHVLTGAFWGNLGCTYYHLNSVSGPLFLEKSPYVDFLTSPSNYEDRVPGGGATFRAPVDSLAFRGKLWFNESDTVTFKTSCDYAITFGGPFTLKESLDVIKRDFAQVLCDDVQAWWFDMRQGERVYDHPDILVLFKRQQSLAREYYDSGRGKVSEVACVYDQDSLWYVDQDTSRDLVWWNRTLTIPRFGFPCDHIFVDDFELDNLSEYKMYIFINCFYLTESKRKLINERAKRDGKVLLWVYASGLLNPDARTNMSLENMQDLTGFGFGADEGPREATFRVLNSGHEMSKGLSPHILYGRYQRPIMNFFNWKQGEVRIVHPSLSSPLIYVQDADATSLGWFVTNDQPAFSVKDFEGWRSVYLGAKVLNPAIIRGVAKSSGVHIYLDTDDIVYANKRFLTVHASMEDTKHICLPRIYKNVTDAYTDETIASSTDRFDVKMRLGETRMFKLT